MENSQSKRDAFMQALRNPSRQPPVLETPDAKKCADCGNYIRTLSRFRGKNPLCKKCLKIHKLMEYYQVSTKEDLKAILRFLKDKKYKELFGLTAAEVEAMTVYMKQFGPQPENGFEEEEEDLSD